MAIGIRKKIWYLFLANLYKRKILNEAYILPWWYKTFMAVLFPLECFYWKMSRKMGYQMETDTWIIEGVHYSAESLSWLSGAEGLSFRVKKTGKTIIFEQIR